jgi:hypothetical protein
MTAADWVIDLALVAVVLLQLRERRFGWRTVLVPVAIAAIAVARYVHSVPTAGDDLVLMATLAAAGIVVGAGSGLATHVRIREGQAFLQASVAAVVLWVLGTAGRLAFQLYATHGGQPNIERFSMRHHITSSAAWVVAILAMAVGSIAARLAVLWLRAHRAGWTPSIAAAPLS